MSSLPNGESMGTKLVELFANQVVERRKMINDYLSGRACIERVRGSVDFEVLSFSCSSELFLALLAILLGFTAFLAFYWLLWFSLF
jgi:hypothetical protein